MEHTHLALSQSLAPHRPFLKWAGGKQRLLPHLLSMLPAGRRLVEPFVGGGSVFLGSTYPSYLLSDANADLVSVYGIVRDDLDTLIKRTQELFAPKNFDETAYRHHRQTFNETEDPLEKAALFVYLNRFGFNGLCRYNRRGEFNVPYGHPAKVPRLPVSELVACSRRLAAAELLHGDFTDAMLRARKGDVVYCDPPYLDLDDTRSFTSYTATGFSVEQHEALADLATHLLGEGIPVVVSNHDTTQTRELYRRARLHSISVRRSISALSASRKPVAELIAVFEP